MDRGAWWTTVHRVAKVRHDLATKTTETACSNIARWSFNPGSLSEGNNQKKKVSFLFRLRFSNILAGWILTRFCCNKDSNFNTRMYYHAHTGPLMYIPITPNTPAYMTHHTHLPSDTKHLCRTLHKRSLAAGYPWPNFQLSLPCLLYFKYTLLLSTSWTCQIHFCLCICSFLCWVSLSWTYFPGLLSFPQKALPWPHNQSGTQISVLSQMEKKLEQNYTNHSFILSANT